MYNLNSDQLAELAKYLNQYNNANDELERLGDTIRQKSCFKAEAIKKLKKLGIDVNTKASNEKAKKEARLKYLSNCSTAELTEELIKREGIESINVAAYEQYEITTNNSRLEGYGPVIIIVNED